MWTLTAPSRRTWPRRIPRSCKALIKAWFEEADKNLVLPLDDRTALEVLSLERPSEEPARERYIYYPDTAPVPEGVAANIRGRSYKILADVEITDANCSGVIFADGFALRRSHAVHQGPEAALRLQLPRHQAGAGVRLAAARRPASTPLGMEFIREKAGPNHESLGHDQALRQRQGGGGRPDEDPDRASSAWAAGSASGTRAATPSASSYTTPGKFHGGRILGVGVTVEKTSYADLAKEAQAAFARD